MTLEQKEQTPDRISTPPDPISPAEKAQPERTHSRRKRLLRIAALLLGIPLLLCAAYWLLGVVAFADAASLVEMKGIVQTRSKDDSRWSPAQLKDMLWGEDRVRTGDGSGARLLFFDVTTVDLFENTEVSITRVAKRRGGNAVDVVLKTWVGKTAIRAVRFVDPSSTFRVDTPTASTVVRGARFTVEVTEEGTTQIDLQDGIATVQTQDEVVTIGMGERITLDPGGTYETERIFEPDTQPVVDKVSNAWLDPQELLELELDEAEVNQFLAGMNEDADFFLRDTQVWFLPGEARIATTVVKPARFDLSAALGIEVVGGRLKPDLSSIAAGVSLPVPAPILDLAVETVLGRLEGYLAQAYDFVEFEHVEIRDGSLFVVGHKREDAPQ
jgi:ferric-dicitrate binding protein FerR (iron transport regulator)